ncbi:PepSY-like domain-containing protein [Chryseobacterium sp.]|uniref:PepSY-like domain-containing protein n=1 Tax=Chryseobacterium sp. TaxID=1871047 RepID=UPI00388DCF9E
MKNFRQVTAAFSILFLLVGSLVFAQDRAITYTQLPQNAQKFIKANFKNVKTSSILEDREIFGVDEYKIHMANGMKIEFDGKGNWKEVDGKHQKVPYNFIPAGIRNHIAKTFPNTHIIKIERKTYSYKAELSNGLDLEFDANGNFTRIDD